MPISPEYVATLARALFEMYDEAETRLLHLITSRLAQGIDDEHWATAALDQVHRLRAEAVQVTRALTVKGVDVLAATAWEAYRKGAALAATDLTQAGIGVAATGVDRRAVLAAVQRRILDLAAAEHTTTGSTIEVYRSVVHRTAARMLLTGETRREAAYGAVTEWADKGITGFVDRSGRRWELGTYAEMTARTAATDAMVTGHEQQLQDAGHDLVMVSDAPQECRICRRFESRILSLSGSDLGQHTDHGTTYTVMCSVADARAAGLFHPGCRHRLVAYFPGITPRLKDTADPEGDAQRQKQRAYERRVRELKRRVQSAEDLTGRGSPTHGQANAQLRAKRAEFKAWREQVGAKNLQYREGLVSR